jgi:PAS domain S-box-containing protein
MNIFDAFPRVKGSFFEQKYYEALENNKKICFETYFGKPPSEKWYHFKIIPNSSDVSIFLRDIDKEKKIESELLEKEREYQLLTENATDMISTHDALARYIYVSPYVEKLLGFRPEEIIGKNAYDFMHPEDISLMHKYQLNTLYEDNNDPIEYRLRKKDGNYIWVESSARSVKEATGDFICFITITRDLTQRKKAEKALKESEIYYKTIFENTGTATIIIEDGKTISRVNSEFEKLYGAPKDSIEGKIKWTSFVHPDYRDMMIEYHEKRSVEPDSVPREYEFKFLDYNQQVKDVQITVAVIPGTQRRLVSLIDVSERNKALKRLKWELKVNESLNKVYAPLVSSQTNLEDIASVILTQALELTKSPLGYVGEIIPETRSIGIISMVHPLSEEYYSANPIIGLDEKHFYGDLMQQSVDKKETFVSNEVASYKTDDYDDQLKIDKFLSVPVLDEGKVIGQISVSNSPRNYDEKDVAAVERLADFYTLALQRVRTEEKVRESLQEQKLLLREIHHRVKNNLQIISSLLNLQSQYMEDEETQKIFLESKNRVKSMALIHEKLYRSSSLAHVNFEDYVESLVESLIYSYMDVSANIQTEIDLNGICLNIDTAIPCGLIINELVSNSLKHAFQNSQGTIKIEMKGLNGKYLLKVCDDGVGFPKEIDFKNTETLGMQLINSLVIQLDGNIEQVNSSGTCFKINIKESNYKKRV